MGTSGRAPDFGAGKLCYKTKYGFRQSSGRLRIFFIIALSEASILASASNPYWSVRWATIGLGYLPLSRGQGAAAVLAFFVVSFAFFGMTRLLRFL
jgi:hypothetical protein